MLTRLHNGKTSLGRLLHRRIGVGLMINNC